MRQSICNRCGKFSINSQGDLRISRESTLKANAYLRNYVLCDSCIDEFFIWISTTEEKPKREAPKADQPERIGQREY